MGAGGGSPALRLLKRPEQFLAQPNGVGHGLEARRKGFPFLVAEIGMA